METKSDNKWIKGLSYILAVSLAANLILYMKSTELFPAKKEMVEQISTLHKQLSTYKNEINKYKGISLRIDAVVEDANEKMEIKEQQIVSLKREKRVTENENQKLLAQLDSLKEQYLSVIDTLLVEREQRNVINQKVEGLEEVIIDLNTKLGIAGMLVGDNLVVTPLKKNRRGKRQPSAMVQKIHEIVVCLDILENRMSRPGIEKIYFVIRDIRVIDNFS